MARLTEKQKRFADEYLVDLNATQAAIRAGYSEKSASRIAVELLNKTQVLEYLQKRRGELQSKLEITQEKVLEELAAIGFSRATDYVQVQNGRVQINDTGGLTDIQKGVIASIKEGRNGIEIKLYDKIGALHLLGQHLGMFDSRAGQNQNTENNIFDVIDESTGKEIDTSAIPEIEPETESGDDLVE